VIDVSRKGEITILFSEELVIPSFIGRRLEISFDQIDPLSIFDVEFITKNHNEKLKIRFELSITEWTSTKMTLVI
jgi:hypothetical protein